MTETPQYKHDFHRAMSLLSRRLKVSMRRGIVSDALWYYSAAWAESHNIQGRAVAVHLDEQTAEVQLSLIDLSGIRDADGFYLELPEPKHHPLRVDATGLGHLALAKAIEREADALCAIEHATGI